MTDNLLEIKDLSVEYHTEFAKVYAVNGLSLTLKYGETLGLVGETGAGKTTTALSVIRLLPDGIGHVTGGSIMLDGNDMVHMPEEKVRTLRGKTVSMIFQDPMTSLNPIKTIGDQILEVLRTHNRSMAKEALNRQVDKMMEMVGIPAYRKNEYPHEFSGGMKHQIPAGRLFLSRLSGPSSIRSLNRQGKCQTPCRYPLLYVHSHDSK